jgi:H+/gluconate symporter-like permease
MGAGTLNTLPHNGGVVSLLAVCGLTHRQSYFDVAIVGMAGPVLALVAVVALGAAFGSLQPS